MKINPMPEICFRLKKRLRSTFCVLSISLIQGAANPVLQGGVKSADGKAVLIFEVGYPGVRCCSMYWRTTSIEPPPQLPAK